MILCVLLNFCEGEMRFGHAFEHNPPEVDDLKVLNTLEASFEHNPLPADRQFWLSEMKPVVGLYDELTVSFDSPR